jgi:formate dehydrogenase iron-sulfur subunit
MTDSNRQVGLLVDVPYCNGCSQCLEACAQVNELKPPTQRIEPTADGLSADRWAAIVESKQGGYVRKSCRHCLEPACVSVCPVGAMYRTSEGVVLYDAEKCMGCRYCMMACPYGIPRYQWDSPAPQVRKCILCHERLDRGLLPACVESCPNGVLTFGTREEMLALAQDRIEKNPLLYLPTIYGAQEVGGTAVLYISHVPLDFLGYHGAPLKDAMPDLTWPWLSKVPGISLGAAGLMAGLFWIIERRLQSDLALRAKSDNNTEERDHG